MYHIGREAVTSVGQLQGRDRKAVVDQVNLIPHWSKGNFGELCPLLPPRGSLLVLSCKRVIRMNLTYPVSTEEPAVAGIGRMGNRHLRALV